MSTLIILPTPLPAAADLRNHDTVLVLGLGDLGRRIAVGMACSSRTGSIVLAGRDCEVTRSHVRMITACTSKQVQHNTVDGLDSVALRELIERVQPRVIVQCASLLSPWNLHERTDRLAGAMRKAGFALQLSAQLPVVTALMRAVRASGIPCAVVNCSYPDVTHPVLAAQGLAPDIGIGNAGMVLGLVRAALGPQAQPVRVLAHHAHVGPIVSATRTSLLTCVPRVFVGEREVSNIDFLFAGQSIAMNRELNILSAAHALAIIDAMLPDARALETSAPGPLGLAGGWPVRIVNGHISLDLPKVVSQSECNAFQQIAARADGIERIDSDGTTHFTEWLREQLPADHRNLALPLHPDAALERHRQLKRALNALP